MHWYLYGPQSTVSYTHIKTSVFSYQRGPERKVLFKETKFPENNKGKGNN